MSNQMRTNEEFEKKHGRVALVELIKAKRYLTCSCDVCRKMRDNQLNVVDDIVSTMLHLLFGPGCLSLEDAINIVRTKGVYMFPSAENPNEQKGKEEIRHAEEGEDSVNANQPQAA